MAENTATVRTFPPVDIGQSLATFETFVQFFTKSCVIWSHEPAYPHIVLIAYARNPYTTNIVYPIKLDV